MYHLWAGHTYYPGIGEHDYVGAFKRIEDAEEAGMAMCGKTWDEWDDANFVAGYKSPADWYCIMTVCADSRLRELITYRKD